MHYEHRLKGKTQQKGIREKGKHSTGGISCLDANSPEITTVALL